jgi:hypothetical protein
MRIPTALLAKAERLVLIAVSESGIVDIAAVPVDNQAAAVCSNTSPRMGQPAHRTALKATSAAAAGKMWPPVLLLSVLGTMLAVLLLALMISARKLWIKSLSKEIRMEDNSVSDSDQFSLDYGEVYISPSVLV